jgi:asparagine synthase (glutamine-hydrolysing)
MTLANLWLAYRIKRSRLSYLDFRALNDLAQATDQLESNHLEGCIVEAGCALGGSAIMLAATKSKNRELQVFDVFGTIPPPSDRDDEDVHDRYRTIASGESKGISGDVYYGYQENLVDTVRENFKRMGFEVESNRVSLIQGLFQDTMPRMEGAIALAHIDGDWYDSVMTCLNEVAPRLVLGGRMIFDDYDVWSGCRKAVDDFLKTNGDAFKVERKSRLHLVKIR